jgi:hypothetical protein
VLLDEMILESGKDALWQEAASRGKPSPEWRRLSCFQETVCPLRFNLSARWVFPRQPSLDSIDETGLLAGGCFDALVMYGGCLVLSGLIP